MTEERTITTLEDARKDGALVYIDQNIMPKTKLYRAEFTSIEVTDDEVFTISGKKMPKRELVDRIGDAAGIVFIEVKGYVECREDPALGKHTVYIGQAQGKIRISDGSWRTSSLQEYEFDPTLRAMLDKNVYELNERTRPQVARQILEYQKVGKQRAQTGARTRVIRELTGMPTAFTDKQIKLPLRFARVVQNTEYILHTPEGRIMATAQALGQDISALYGRKALAAAPEEETMRQAETQVEDAPWEPAEKEPEKSAGELAKTAAAPAGNGGNGASDDNDELVELEVYLEHILQEYRAELTIRAKNGECPYDAAQAELDNMMRTPASLRAMTDRIVEYLKKSGVWR